jgi:hypothetical protein
MPKVETLFLAGSFRVAKVSHKAATPFIADRFGRRAGGIAVCLVMAGPGTTNAVTAAACALREGMPMLLVSGQSSLSAFGRDPAQNGSAPAADAVRIFENVTKQSLFLAEPERATDSLRSSIRCSFAGRPGPTHIAIPDDLWKKVVVANVLRPVSYRAEGQVVDSSAVARAAHLLLNSCQPVVLAGSGIRGAFSELRAVVEMLGAPVAATTPKAKGVLPEYHPLSLQVFGFAGSPLPDKMIVGAETDCSLILGSRHAWDRRLRHAPSPDGTACDDEDVCDGAERCLAGRCTSGTPVVCSTQGQCREMGVCDPATGAYTSPPRDDGSGCDDGDVCTLQDSCVAGSCVSGKPVACSSGDPCRTDGVSDPTTGLCSGSPRDDGTRCDDHDPCTAGDSCQQETCRGGTPVTCPSPGTCRDLGTCDPATGACTDPPKPDGTACSSGGVCSTGDTCVGGVCKPGAPVCPPIDQCHDAGPCDHTSSTCVPVPKSNGTVCDDHNPCTRLDTCQAGACVGGDPVNCAPADQCSDAGICNPTTWACTKVPKPDGTSCNDVDACTRADSCRGGQCAGGEPVVCAAADPGHTQGTCDPSTGICSSPAKDDGTAGDDKNPCTLGETCQEGTCSAATPVTCVAADECHGAGTCDPLTGLCSNPIKGDGEPCQDGDACTRADSCQSGICVGENPITCVAQDSCHRGGICNPQTERVVGELGREQSYGRMHEQRADCTEDSRGNDRPSC